MNKSWLDDIKNLFYLLEANISKHRNGYLYKSDFRFLKETTDPFWMSKSKVFKRFFDCFSRSIKKLNLYTLTEDEMDTDLCNTEDKNEMCLSFLDFAAGMVAYNPDLTHNKEEIMHAYKLINDPDGVRVGKHMQRQDLYDAIRNSVDNVEDDGAFLNEFNKLIDKEKDKLGVMNVKLTQADYDTDG